VLVETEYSPGYFLTKFPNHQKEDSGILAKERRSSAEETNIYLTDVVASISHDQHIQYLGISIRGSDI